jgi:hypothetical protein
MICIDNDPSRYLVPLATSCLGPQSAASLLCSVLPCSLQSHSPMHRGSDIKAILLLAPTSMQSLPCLTTGQDFLHSCRHFLGLQRSELTIAMRVRCSSALSRLSGFFLGGIARGLSLCTSTHCDSNASLSLYRSLALCLSLVDKQAALVCRFLSCAPRCVKKEGRRTETSGLPGLVCLSLRRVSRSKSLNYGCCMIVLPMQAIISIDKCM